MNIDPHYLPPVNACLNATAGILLLFGFKAIKAGKREVHQKFMICALVASTLFLCSYLTYHYLSPGVTRYQGEGILRIIYYTILLTHTPLAAIIVPFCIAAVIYAIKGNFEKHVKLRGGYFPLGCMSQ